ncbi:uncharacterized protein TNCV_3007601 [Trichonephila clavipes]|nr:uncharacterized protein TNCV_3007601 [Trichonephila clavipes]
MPAFHTLPVTYTLQDAVFIYHEQSPNKARSVAFSQCAKRPRLIEDETLNDCVIINNLIDYVDGQEEPDSLRANKICTEIQLSNKLGKSSFLK